jgi:hypothetical protein
VLDQRVRALALVWTASVWTASLLGGCAEPQWARQTWPSDTPSQLDQPEAYAEPLSLRLSARAITWEPEAIVVELVLVNEGERELVVDPAAVFLGYDGLEYAAVIGGEGSEVIAMARGDEQVIELRYSIGRALTRAGAVLRLRGLRSAGEWVVEVPELPVPAMPADARSH